MIAVNFHMAQVLPRLTDSGKGVPQGTGIVEEEIVRTIEYGSRFLTDHFIDEQDRGSARWSSHPCLPTSIVHLPAAIGFPVVIHTSHFT